MLFKSLQLSEEEYKSLFDDLDVNSNNQIDINDFLEIIQAFSKV